MPLPFRIDTHPETDRQPLGAGEDEDFSAMLKPILAGARARGVADGLEMLGAGAVLIDATGRVLHVGGRARRMMGGWLRIAGDHLVAERVGDNRAVEDLIGGVLVSVHGPVVETRLEALGGSKTLALKAIPFASDEGKAQRLHAVIVMDELQTG